MSQDLLRSDYFVVRYESSKKFSVEMFNSTNLEGSGFKSVSTNTYSAGSWQHIAVVNSEALSKSSIYVNGIDVASSSFVAIDSSFSAFTVSNDTTGFTGMFRDIRFWGEVRSPGEVRAEMHNWQSSMTGMRFNLKGYYPLNEGRGTTLYDYYSVSPTNVYNFEASRPPLVSPFWARSETLPAICGLAQRYDFDKDICKVKKLVLSISSTGITLPIDVLQPLRDWTFHAWVLFPTLAASTAYINIPNLLSITGASGSSLTVVVTTDSATSTTTLSGLTANKWYHLIAGYHYARGVIVVEYKDPSITLGLTAQPTTNAGESTYYGITSIVLKNARFMHVSLWKKYLQATKYWPAAPTDQTTEFMDPVFWPGVHPNLISYWPFEESSGKILNDVSIYGKTHDFTSSFGTSAASWVYDDYIDGKLLFSKHFQDYEASPAKKFYPKGRVCSGGGCMYCSTSLYCKACSPEMILQYGNCTADPLPSGYFEDTLEKEYMQHPNLNTCDDPHCKRCTANSATCTASTDCIRNSFYLSTMSACYGDCPIGSYKSGSACAACTANCLSCNVAGCLTCEEGYLLNAGLTCVDTNCGDGVLDVPETCDDGNTVSGDGCSKYCLIEPHFTCQTTSGPSVCTPICGDGYFYGLNGEECDDGNTASGDGCDSTCKVEVGWWCTGGSPTTPSVCYCSPTTVPGLNTFSANYMTVSFKFSRSLLVLVSTTDLCKTLFGTSTSLLGSSYSCSNQSDTLVVTLGPGNKVYAGTILPIASGVLGTSGCGTFSGSVVAPTIPAQNVFGEIEVISSLPYCEKLPIWIKNIAGGLNRPFTSISLTVNSISGGGSDQIIVANRELINWQLLSLTKIDDATYLGIIPENTLLPGATYLLKLSLTNFQGITYVSTATFTSVSGLLVALSLEGLGLNNALNVERSADVLVRAVPKLSQCGVSTPNISDIMVNFTQTNSDDVLNLTVLYDLSNDRVLHLPANTLKADTEYDFLVTCISKSSNATLASQTFVINAAASSLVPVVWPTSQTSREDQPLSISGSGSFDRKLSYP